MYKNHLQIFCILLVGLFTSCSTYQYTARQVNVNRTDIDSKKQGAAVKIDYTRTVTATSGYSITRGEAMREAEYLCLQNEGVDVIIDPIFKLEFDPFRFKKNWKATVTGFVGTYEETPVGVETVKDYQMEDIEKYKMLTDPSFPQYYYDNGNGGNYQGDTYYFNSSSPVGVAPQTPSSSIVQKPTAQDLKMTQQFNTRKVYDYRKSKQLRDAGISLSVIGGLMIGFVGPMCTLDTSGRYGYMSEDAETAFLSMEGLGAFIATPGIIMACVGAHYMKHSFKNTELAFGPTSNGIGATLNF